MKLMPQSERFYRVTPETDTALTEGFRVAPNEKSFPLDATVFVDTEDGHKMTFKMFPKGPAESEYLISLVSSEPPLSQDTLHEKEVYVRDDIIKRGETFHLDSADPILARTAFTALRITSNIKPIVLQPTQSIPIIDTLQSLRTGEIDIRPDEFNA